MTDTHAMESQAAGHGNDRAIAIWLLVCCAMIFLMALIGAITRLTESGLSIMEWAPVTGALPPLSQAEWERVFALYQEIPEFRHDNPGMELVEFKTIFWWEYIHRLLGRMIGLVFLLPFLWFLVRRRIRRGLTPHLVAIFVLGGLQGGLGWFMVASGFAELTDVSHYRLTAHLALALLIYGYIFWIATGLLSPDARTVGTGDQQMRQPLVLFLLLVSVTILSGGLVAGLNAGLIYNSFPLMDGRLIPDGYGDLNPFALNLVENIAAVQFNHRLLAVATALAALGLWGWSRKLAPSPALSLALHLLALAALAQVALGIATLLLVVPVSLAALHQGGAIVLLTAGLWALRVARPPLQDGQAAL